MIKSVQIENFKSIDKLNLELGRFNVLIGENGCGKSNILEAIALGGAASANQLKKEFLVSRGIRVSSPDLMRAGFTTANAAKEIKIQFTLPHSAGAKQLDLINIQPDTANNKNGSDRNISFKLQNKNKAYSEWYDPEKKEITEATQKFILGIISGKKVNSILDLEPEQLEKAQKFSVIVEVGDKDKVMNLFASDTMCSIIDELYQNDNYDDSFFFYVD